jgi:hypothetical protein
MGKFLCSDTGSGLQGSDTVIDSSELTGGDVTGDDVMIDTSVITLIP